MILKANHWYICTSHSGSIETQILKVSEDFPVSSEDWVEISPPTIPPIPKDLSHAKVGDTVKWLHPVALIMLFFKVLFAHDGVVILLEVDSMGELIPGIPVRKVCNKEEYSLYTLVP